MFKIKIVVCIALWTLSVASFAQSELDSVSTSTDVPQDTSSQEYVSTEESVEISDFRPIIGVSGGMLTYFGEISRAQRANTAFTSNLAFDVRASFPLKNSFYISFRALYGKVSANERTVDKNRNFQSQITNFGLDFSYNFNHFLSEKRVLDPFLSVGFDAFVFNSKTDLYDANGNLYYYWSDGSIKDRAETPENLNTAQELNRDYDYETDYRRSNVSGAGYYEKYSFAIPVGAGVNMRLSHRMHAKLGATYSFLFTDLMDGVSSKGKGVYEGDAANDGLLYTYVGLSFDLSKRSGSIDDDDVDGISNEELAAMTTGDSDFDGVADLNDECPETPGGVEVDEVGCPLDEDKDGVPDYRDQELGTDSNAVVDSNGIALTDEQLERIYLRFMDSTGVLSYYEDTIYTNDLPTQTFRKKDKQFSVQIDNDSLTSEQASQLLSEGKVKTVKDGDKDALLVGEFKTIEEALAKDKELKSKGIGTRAIVVETPTGKVVNANIVGVFVGDQSGKQLEKSQPGTVFRIQVGAFRGEPDPKYFKGMNVIGVKNDDGLTRYYTGNYSSYDKAAKARVQLKGAGYGDCVIKAFAEGGQVSLKDAGATFIAPEPGTETGNTNTGNAGPKRDKSKVKFKVQLGSYQNSIPMEDFNKYVKLGEIKSEKGLDGYTRYFVGTFSTYEEAEAFKKELEQKGIPEAFVAGEYDGKTISAQDAIDILEE